MLLALSTFSLSVYIVAYTWVLSSKEDYLEISKGVFFYRKILIFDNKKAVIHIMQMDITNIEISVTPPSLIDNKQQHFAMTTKDALITYQADIAVNASFFAPFKDNHLFDYYPSSGDKVEPIGVTIAFGHKYGVKHAKWPAFVVDKESNFFILSYQESYALVEKTDVRHLVSGRDIFINNSTYSGTNNNKAYPRTVIGLNSSRDKLWLIVVDGKQPFYSDGISLEHLASYLIKQGVDIALELDGGGSATLAWNNKSHPVLLNRPSHTKIPNRQRPVANHILVKLKP